MTVQTLPHQPNAGQATPIALFADWDTVRAISWLTAVLVAILALFAFILSYSSLQHMAAQNGLPGRLSYLWPLLLDFAMLVFSLAILRANLRRERAIYPWILTVAFAGLATLANILDVATLGVPPVVIAASVKALAPIALVLAFELLMSMLRAEVKRAAVVKSLTDLAGRQVSLTAQFEKEQAEITTTRNHLTAEIETLTAKRNHLKAELSQWRQQKRAENNPVPARTSETTKAQARQILTERGDITGAELGRLLGRSESLGRRLKRELWPVAGTDLTINGTN